jgi:hypothetical protein
MPLSLKCARLAAVLALCLLIGACKSKVSKAHFDKVREGMTLEDVEKLLGKGTKEEGDDSNVAAQFGVALPLGPTAGGGGAWKRESGTNSITVLIRQGKVVGKQSSGL